MVLLALNLLVYSVGEDFVAVDVHGVLEGIVGGVGLLYRVAFLEGGVDAAEIVQIVGFVPKAGGEGGDDVIELIFDPLGESGVLGEAMLLEGRPIDIVEALEALLDLFEVGLFVGLGEEWEPLPVLGLKTVDNTIFEREVREDVGGYFGGRRVRSHLSDDDESFCDLQNSGRIIML